ncbi:glycosyltransferase [uncultured Sneathiella sp.]|uniref:glycosyltransferase family protein n=1 Tax=uncultured Sneathiella sp. TaxID=879315 RepID=UPI0030EEA6B5|tara:strand:+ start:15671 stop:16903 length:1233 start_codon:yes stop_codon:yes gene_type:complete
MNEIENARRILIYSHDSFGLGHLRRCMVMANSLVEQNQNLSVLILSGSPIIGSFDFKARVDFVRIPGIIKLRNGEYTSLSLHIDTEQTLAMRASIIQHTAETFDPDIFIVDKEPYGLKGEVTGTLEMLKAAGTHLVLGLRDVLDDPSLLGPEWQRKNVLPALEELYDDIWIFGVKQIYNPLAGIDIPANVKRKITYTGYLPRSVSAVSEPAILSEMTAPYVLVTVGGGGDGDVLTDWVLRAYEGNREPPLDALFVLGPFMPPETRASFRDRIQKLPRVRAVTFDSHLESLMQEASAVVAMGGYNTFCEVLSMNKRALIIPRTVPRLEQYIRATRAADAGLIGALIDDGERESDTMLTALRHLAQQKKPSEVVIPGLLDGLTNLNRLVRLRFREVDRRRRALSTTRRAALD